MDYEPFTVGFKYDAYVEWGNKKPQKAGGVRPHVVQEVQSGERLGYYKVSYERADPKKRQRRGQKVAKYELLLHHTEIHESILRAQHPVVEFTVAQDSGTDTE